MAYIKPINFDTKQCLGFRFPLSFRLSICKLIWTQQEFTDRKGSYMGDGIHQAGIDYNVILETRRSEPPLGHATAGS